MANTYEDLAVALVPVGLVIWQPGESPQDLPHIALEPTGISIVPGARVGFETCNVVIRYELGVGNPGAFDELNASTYHALALLLGSRFPVDPDIALNGNANTEPPTFSYTIPVTFAGRDICPPTEQE